MSIRIEKVAVLGGGLMGSGIAESVARSGLQGMKLGCGHPMGPLTLADLIGLDVLYAIGDSLYEEFKWAEYAPPPPLKRMVASGRIGRKAGRGFYDYARQREAAAA
jgi:3-hydroxybutyryl-CoA dehydrogenase